MGGPPPQRPPAASFSRALCTPPPPLVRPRAFPPPPPAPELRHALDERRVAGRRGATQPGPHATSGRSLPFCRRMSVMAPLMTPAMMSSWYSPRSRVRSRKAIALQARSANRASFASSPECSTRARSTFRRYIRAL